MFEGIGYAAKCVECGKPFEARSWHLVCGDRCRMDRKNRRARLLRRGEVMECECTQCGKTFEQSVSRVSLCSDWCRQESRKDSSRRYWARKRKDPVWREKERQRNTRNRRNLRKRKRKQEIKLDGREKNIFERLKALAASGRVGN